MKLLFKQRFFSWFDSYDIYDQWGEVLYVVKGQLAWGHCLQIYDPKGNNVGTVQEKVLTFLPTFDLYENGQYQGRVKKEFTFLRPKFQLDYKDWRVQGDIWEWSYQVIRGSGDVVAEIEKMVWNLTDTYEIEVREKEDALYALMVVLAIDAAKCSDND